MKQNRLAGALAGVALLWLASGAWAQVVITNLNIFQRPGTKLVDITYDVTSSGEVVAVSLTVSNAGERVNTASLTGDIGLVPPGTGKSIMWDMGADWNGNYATLSFALSADFWPLYMVVDISGGAGATNYPTAYLDAVPSGGWGDGFKTTNLVLRRIPAGTFIMGSPTNELGRDPPVGTMFANESQHQVTLTKDLYVGVFEVTQKQWERVKGNWPSGFTNAAFRDTRPVEMVSFNDIRGASAGTNWPADNNVDASSFMGRMRTKSGHSFDLPTEAQWEYACRAGTATALNSGKNLTSTYDCPNMDSVGRYFNNGGFTGYFYDWNCGTSNGTAKVGSYLKNLWGLYDMHGNANEWCLNWYAYTSTGTTDPPGPTSGSARAVRGGSWYDEASRCRSAIRWIFSSPSVKTNFTGFRTVVAVP